MPRSDSWGSRSPTRLLGTRPRRWARHPGALAAANRVVKAQNSSVDSQAFLGSIHERLGQPREAEAIYRALLGRNPANLEAGRALASLPPPGRRGPAPAPP